MPAIKLDQRRVDALKLRKSAYDVRDRDLKGLAQLVNRMGHLVTAAARQARSLAPGARPTRWNQLR